MSTQNQTRRIVLSALMEMEKGGYSNIVLDRALQNPELNPGDKALAARLFYGVVERKLTLDYVLSGHLKKKTESCIQNILRLGLFQILYMDGIPDYSAVNESVQLCYAFKKVSAKGLVNAVLRNIIREGKNLDFSKITSTGEKLSVEYSCSREVTEDLLGALGEENCRELLFRSLQPPVQYGRVNITKTTADVLILRLNEEGVTAEKTEIPGCIRFKSGFDLESLSSFQEGLFHIQDASSQLCALALMEGMTEGKVFDLCAAPGGKAFTAAEILHGRGQVSAFDIHGFKIKLIEEGAARLGLDNISVREGDASVYAPELGTADRVLCDVPCSGFGILAKKPEIKYKKRKEYKTLYEIQLKILSNAAKYVKDGGLLLYSTCTLLDVENDGVADVFLKEHPEFRPSSLPPLLSPCLDGDRLHQATILPQVFDSDGFFLAAFQKGDGA